MSETKLLRAAVIGCGAISVSHLMAIRESGMAEAVALCDIRPERAQEKRTAYAPNARLFTDWEEMLSAMPDIDVVHICTPHYQHAPMAAKALAAGKHVFLEKPVGISEEDIHTLAVAEKNAKGKLCVCFQNRFNDATLLLDELAGRYGTPLGARAFVNWYREEKYYLESGWRGFYETEGGGVMINQAIHTLDLMLRYLGTPEKLSATVANHHLSGKIDVEDSCELTAWFSNGAVGNFYATTSFCKDMPIILEIVYPEHTVLLYGGQVLDNGLPLAVPAMPQGAGKACWGAGHSRLIPLFYRSVLDGTPSPVPFASAALSLKVLLAAYRSCGRKVSVF